MLRLESTLCAVLFVAYWVYVWRSLVGLRRRTRGIDRAVESRKVRAWAFKAGMLFPFVFLPAYAAEYALVRNEIGPAEAFGVVFEFAAFLVLGGVVTSCSIGWLELRWRRSQG